MDANGDLTAVYQGFGPDVNEQFLTTAQSQAVLDSLLSPTGPNANLVTQWDNNNAIGDPKLEDLSLPLDTIGNNGDIDTVIEEVLIDAQTNHLFSNAQLGQLNGILSTVARLPPRRGRRRDDLPPSTPTPSWACSTPPPPTTSSTRSAAEPTRPT